jgi:hypothetical protein
MSEIGIRIGAAGNQAALVLEGAWRAIADGKATVDQISEIYADLTANFVNTMDTLQAAHGLATAFPGTTVATPAEAQVTPFGQTNVSPFPTQPQVAFQQVAAAAPGVTHKDDAAWQALFANPKAYWDNRQDKRSPQAPDFKLKDDPDVALWLRGKFGDAPQWVFDRLQGGFGPVQ